MANLSVGVDLTCLHTSQAIQQPVQAGHLPCLVGLRLVDQRLMHQADDQPVALDGAHALLELEQDGLLVRGVAALRLPMYTNASERGAQLRALGGGCSGLLTEELTGI